MAENHLIKTIGAKYEKMSRKNRIETIRGLSADGLNFIQKFSPEFSGGFPRQSRAADENWQSGSRSELFAKSR
jgi:hypothetical protein